MKKILVTGAGGYLGRNIVKQLSENKDLTIIPLTRKDCDLLNYTEVGKLFGGLYNPRTFDVVIHCAVEGDGRLTDDPICALHNLLMFENLYRHRNSYRMFINLASGAENDKVLSDLPYGLSKRWISNAVKQIDNFFNIKIWNVFGTDEDSSRFMKANILRYINKDPIIVHQDRYMDFYFIDDFMMLLRCIIYGISEKETQACYNYKYTLVEVANFINDLDCYKVPIKVLIPEQGDWYTGSSFPKNTIKEQGIIRGMRTMFADLKYGE